LDQTRQFKAQQTASGHDAPNGGNRRGHIALHRLLPQRQLKHVQPLDFHPAELINCINGLGFQRPRDSSVVDGPCARVSELGRDLVVGVAGRPELNGPHPVGGSEGSVPVPAIDPGKIGNSCAHTTMMAHSSDKAAH
jgi:hypothetical protein